MAKAQLLFDVVSPHRVDDFFVCLLSSLFYNQGKLQKVVDCLHVLGELFLVASLDV